MLGTDVGNDGLSRACVSEWHKIFIEGLTIHNENCEDDERPGRPCTSTTEENLGKTKSACLLS
ncbi:hypothetical protein J437_LFUL001570 [Ladona fulva]|uniref:Uncharacterized protein n=1 Tax=Ladona fulva TaxID=123851 RepID=A0A8K0KK98_LADFU|nr:hypothetical protein J437_LFUL001570 [Ladona fulva]